APSTIVSVLRNTSMTGSLDASSFAPNVDFLTGNGPQRIVAADLDGDGKLDLIVANQGDAQNNTLSVLRNLLGPAIHPPTVSIVNPVNGAAFLAPAAILLSSIASNSDGTVSRVDFY